MKHINAKQLHNIFLVHKFIAYLLILKYIKNLLTLTDAKNQTTRFEYDLANRMTKEIRPMNQTIEYTYYANGLLKTVKDSKGQVTTYTYDSANRLTQITYADGKQNTFTYDAAGNMITYSSNGISGALTYDQLNRKLIETVNYGPFSKTYSYTYDALSNKATYTSPEGAVYNYTYNKNNQIINVKAQNPNSQTMDFNFDYQWNRLTKATLPNGISTSYAYDNNSRLTNLSTLNSQLSTINSYAYGFDKVGNITRKTDNATSITDYTYDLTYQLTGSTGSSLTEAFTYDKAGNRLIAVLNSSTINYTHNANNEMTSADAATYSYDANGNTIQETNGNIITQYTYDSSNRLAAVSTFNSQLQTLNSAVYTYDSFGRRTKKDINGQVTYYVYADEGLIGEYDSAGNLKKAYGWMPDSIWGTNPVFTIENNQYYFYHNNHLGAPEKVTDSNGTVVWSAEYAAFGKATVNEDPDGDGINFTNNLRLPGQYYDEETKKHYNFNRYYDPETGRYISADPIGFVAGDANLFRYVFNSSVNLIDPLGLKNKINTGYNGVKGLMMRLGEKLREKALKEFFDKWGQHICNAASNSNIDPAILFAILKEEISHVLPLERFVEDYLGLGDTVGPGQINVNVWSEPLGIDADALIDTYVNIDATAEILRIEKLKLLETGNTSPEMLGSRYNSSKTSKITDYGIRVGNFYKELEDYVREKCSKKCE